MPVTWDDAAAWDAAYKIHISHTETIGYGLQFWQLAVAEFDRRVLAMVGRNLVAGNKTHLVVGCAFGYLMQVILETYGVTVYGTDLSAWIHANLATEQSNATIRARVLNIDITSPTAQADFQAAQAGNQGGSPASRGKFSGVICTENVLESYNDHVDPLQDTGLQAVLNACEALSDGGAIWHFVNTLQQTEVQEEGGQPVLVTRNDPAMRNMTLEQWRDLRPLHYWCATNERLSDGSLRVIGGGV